MRPPPGARSAARHRRDRRKGLRHREKRRARARQPPRILAQPQREGRPGGPRVAADHRRHRARPIPLDRRVSHRLRRACGGPRPHLRGGADRPGQAHGRRPGRRRPGLEADAVRTRTAPPRPQLPQLQPRQGRAPVLEGSPRRARAGLRARATGEPGPLPPLFHAGGPPRQRLRHGRRRAPRGGQRGNERCGGALPAAQRETRRSRWVW